MEIDIEARAAGVLSRHNWKEKVEALDIISPNQVW